MAPLNIRPPKRMLLAPLPRNRGTPFGKVLTGAPTAASALCSSRSRTSGALPASAASISGVPSGAARFTSAPRAMSARAASAWPWRHAICSALCQECRVAAFAPSQQLQGMGGLGADTGLPRPLLKPLGTCNMCLRTAPHNNVTPSPHTSGPPPKQHPPVLTVCSRFEGSAATRPLRSSAATASASPTAAARRSVSPCRCSQEADRRVACHVMVAVTSVV